MRVLGLTLVLLCSCLLAFADNRPGAGYKESFVLGGGDGGALFIFEMRNLGVNPIHTGEDLEPFLLSNIEASADSAVVIDLPGEVGRDSLRLGRVPHTVVVNVTATTPSDIKGVRITVTGKDLNKDSIEEEFQLTDNKPECFWGTKAFWKVNKIRIMKQQGPSVRVDLARGPRIGLPVALRRPLQPMAYWIDGSLAESPPVDSFSVNDSVLALNTLGIPNATGSQKHVLVICATQWTDPVLPE